MKRRTRPSCGAAGLRLTFVVAIALLTSGPSHQAPAARRVERASAAGATLDAPMAPSTAATTTTTPPLVPPPVATTTTIPAQFAGSVTAIDAATAAPARMTASWRPGCPVPLADLRLVTITHWGFDRRVHQGELVVHADHAENVRDVFASLFEAGFPIDQVRLVDEFGADDDRSMAANNTSGFNCRRARGSARWSEHAYGRAIDINPLQNPYLTRSGAVLPPGGREFVRRDASRPGIITGRSPVVAAFAGIGWRWGGAWPNPDYQHFSASGR